MSDTESEVVVARSDDRGRYEVTVDGKQAGFTECVDRGGQRIFTTPTPKRPAFA